MTDLANNAAAVAAGYARIQTDRGAGTNPRFNTRYEKPMAGPSGDPGYLDRHDGWSNVDQATADTVALNALNGGRKLRYGQDATVNKSSRDNSKSHTFDN